MYFDNKEDKEKDDFFDNEETVERPAKEPKKPVYKSDDPAFWEEEESEWEHLKPRFNFRLWCWVIGAFLVIGIMIAGWLRYFSPYVEDAVQYGYIENIEKRGSVFKTFEGVMIPYRELMDTTRIYERDFMFSVADAKTAAAMREALYKSKPVRVTYKKYHATVPWRGASKIVVTSVDTVDASKILPPEFSPIQKK